MMIVGEPVEKLHLWGQSACALKKGNQDQILVFGGFGGLGRHGRRNNLLMLDLQSGFLKDISAKCSPSSRLGHTSSVIGDSFFIIGGRTGPTEILNDVWLFDLVGNNWKLLKCTGSVFHPRHRHAAAVVGTDIYVFGGLNNEVIYSTMDVFDTQTLKWSNVKVQGDWPSARHSHSLVAKGYNLFMFGGYDGENALGDFFVFNIKTLSWKNERPTGRTPFPRFSHSMFIYENYIGVIGGCPLRQEHHEIALFDLIHHVWKYVTVGSVGRQLWIRSSINVVNDDLVIIGGGVSCYAFGTKFNPPSRICLHSIIGVASDSDNQHQPISLCNRTVGNPKDSISACLKAKPKNSYGSSLDLSEPAEGYGHPMEATHAMLPLERKYAKHGKDILKRFGWLDLGRKVQSSQDGYHICLPVTNEFLKQRSLYLAENSDAVNNTDLLTSFTQDSLSKDEISFLKAVGLLLACGGSLINDTKPNLRKVPNSPQKLMLDAVGSLVDSKGISRQLLKQIPTRWERLGDIVVLPVTSFKDPIWDSIKEELWSAVAKSLGTHRLARQGRVSSTGTRDSTLEILTGASGWVDHLENGIIYSFDPTRCMFSLGNRSEKLRMSQLDCRNEIIVDLFAGIGYFVLPFLVKAKAKFVYACEWNPHALEALRYNIHANAVADRCIILEGDNRVTAPEGIADRVCLGLLPTSEGSWPTAVKALRPGGGTLHVHGNVNDIDERSWTEYVTKSIDNIAKSEGRNWDVSIAYLERVKWYGPHIRHLVADITCKQRC